MFAICLVRSAGETIDGNTGTTIDVQWSVFWHLIEASVAVTVVSLTAFRSLYGIKTLQQEQKNKKRDQPWLASYRKNMFNRRKQRRIDEFGNPILTEHDSLPSIPGATLTGMRTVIGGTTTTTTTTATSAQALSGRSDLPSVDQREKDEETVLIKDVHDFDMNQSVRSYV